MRLQALHHVTFAVRDLDRQETFVKDFGLVIVERTDSRLVMKTCGGDPFAYVAVKGEENRFVGLAFTVENAADLDEAHARLGATAPSDLDLPGGGRSVSLTDPDGNLVLLVHGSQRSEPEPFYPELEHNTPFEKRRFGRNQHGRERGPARLWRIGHVGLFVKSFRTSSEWYEKMFGLIGSDIYHIPGQPQARIVGFFRMDRGDEYVDHHVVAFMQDPRGGCHHISFETQDFEAQQRTHCFLGSKEYEAIWGVGRHPHGSHIFDVWRAPDGARFETFSDTDLFRKEHGTNVHDISQVTMDAWSTDKPDRYFV
ncbi:MULTISPECIES: VOC family protein [unclassified Azospirillum]|uniref:VOC family protein n=1 Tax=unclassified Azospirillum TaxID=2630922 RepID=UPI000B72734E|nr:MULTISPECIES: VOC family protein [unclassified Azospirillum]SNS92877.1 Catechol-2,3-dioxygenase [Azospirillum sp. RU38E]SNT09726.1 Catechol-2,3-dioxygenase [Azospirillum sp. RU37A]